MPFFKVYKILFVFFFSNKACLLYSAVVIDSNSSTGHTNITGILSGQQYTFSLCITNRSRNTLTYLDIQKYRKVWKDYNLLDHDISVFKLTVFIE